MKIHTMIAEDEQLAREELIYLLEKEQDVKLLPSAETGEQLVELYIEHEPDVIFLDVHMPGMRGVDAAKKITELVYMKAPLFVFTTAYDEYAVEAFDIEAIDYMLKPYDTERFQTAMNRIRKRMQQVESNGKRLSNQHIQQATKLLIDDNDRTVVLSPDAIYYAVPFKRMLEIHTEDKVIHSRMTLQELEKKLQGYAFFRTHRSYLVNLNHVQEITPWFNGTSNVTLKDKKQTTIPVSRAARKHLFDLFGN
ncbi:LytR/AlgR family response regulator transcription factor [Oceanobacillus polygoni]|uniref:Two-component system response regulator LytT n=1 Tax=Oceanobacillus polygoni TaxID=1235259 RepID=A0A9X1CK74_9BACI|nr:LytTR family DNA-binding domain-containing protein [Oceanobacillus polygoni]MBP2079242.1 two-component system response regulator LytT [Oceanobacillus polygoni]